MAANQGPPYRGQGPDPVALEARCRAAVAAVAPELLDLNAYRVRIEDIPQPIITDPKSLAWRPDCYTKARSLAAESSGLRGRGFVPNDEVIIPPDPARPGPFPTCASAPTPFYHDVNGVPIHLIAYAPGSQVTANHCNSAASDCPLVVIFHARPFMESIESYYLQYEALGRHLASYGFVVVSVQWGASPSTEDLAESALLLKVLLGWITSGGLGIMKILSDSLVLLGHSNGGYIVDRSATPAVVNSSGFNLRAVVLMSPSDVIQTSNTYTNPQIDALLVLHDVGDQDESANGGLNPKLGEKSVGTAVLAYELAGFTSGGDINSTRPILAKHFAYAEVNQVEGGVIPEQCPELSNKLGSHYYQNSMFASSYTVAFLQKYVRHMTNYGSYIREQQAIPSMAGVNTINGTLRIWHMHSEPSETVLVDWASPMAVADVQGTTSYQEKVSLPSAESHGLNHGWALRVGFVRGNECTVSIKVNLAAIPNLESYSLLSLSVCQAVRLGKSHLSDIEGASVSLSSTKSGKYYAAKFVDIGGPLVYHGCDFVRQVVIDERVLRLSLVGEAVSIHDVDNITLRFETFEDVGSDAVLLLGNIKLIGKGP
ncbi:MAG: hypothetical protein IPK80_03695 [Nannocystis sp.]|nr:hypothetical protein [Nannocystis sp.]